MTTAEWIMVVAVVTGPLFAVLISIWTESKRSKREAKLVLLRILLSTRDLGGDPGYQTAIKLIPVNFHDNRSVLDAHAEFLQASAVSTDDKKPEEAKRIVDNTSIKLTRLLYEMAQAVGLKLRETDIQTGTFVTRGFIERDTLAQDSQRAMRDVANVLWMQTRMMAGEKLPDILAAQVQQHVASQVDEANELTETPAAKPSSRRKKPKKGGEAE